MCGLNGFWCPKPVSEELARSQVLAMADRIAHRGPDDHDGWVDVGAGLALGHRRLSIVDLSAAGHQPMHSASGRFVIAFNGEIYNHGDIRRKLEAQGRQPPAWRGHSDTETLLAAIEAWGIQTALQESIGMFAMALWDRRERQLTLARDRLGEKPLYYGWQRQGAEQALLFGSELKALRAHPAFAGGIDRDALTLYLRLGYLPAPWSIHPGIRKVPPGCMATWQGPDREPQIAPYWSATEAMRAGRANPLDLSAEEAVAELEKLLMDAVGRQMVADVPLGAFLSGGIDSSTVVALMQSQSTRPVKTFSIGFHEEGYNEAEHAKAVATHLGTEHTELYVTAAQAMQVVPRLATMYDEPFSDSSQIPTHLVSQLARRHVTVALSGDAGDELFCGYSRYLLTQALWGRISRIPSPARRLGGALLQSLPEAAWDRVGAVAGHLLPKLQRHRRLGDKIHKGARAIRAADCDALYAHLVSQWTQPERLVPGASEPRTVLTGSESPIRAFPDVPRMMAYDLLTYLPDDILVKVDRAAMAVSLETRVPFLDHRTIEFAWRLPMSLKLRDGTTKWALRQVLYRHVPQTLVERPKMGFGVPIDSWLRGPLRDWAESLLDPAALAADGLLDPSLIRQAWAEHQAGSANLQYPLWAVLMLQAWRAEQRSPGP